MKMNQLYNAKNPYQEDAKRVLCVCSAGLLRSPTIANVLHKEYGYNCRAVGTETGHALIPINSLLIYWADEIVCADDSHMQSIKREFEGSETPIVSLGLDDIYSYMQPELVELIKERYDSTAKTR